MHLLRWMKTCYGSLQPPTLAELPWLSCPRQGTLLTTPIPAGGSGAAKAPSITPPLGFRILLRPVTGEQGPVIVYCHAAPPDFNAHLDYEFQARGGGGRSLYPIPKQHRLRQEYGATILLRRCITSDWRNFWIPAMPLDPAGCGGLGCAGQLRRFLPYAAVHSDSSAGPHPTPPWPILT